LRQWFDAVFAMPTIDRETPDILEIMPDDPHKPLLLLSSAGFDLAARVAAAASASPSSASTSIRSFSMGSSDTSGSAAYGLDKSIVSAAASGGWVVLSNAHLAAAAVVALQNKLAGMKLHPSFRLILTAEISHAGSLSQITFDNSKVVVLEAPRSLRDVLIGSLSCIDSMCSPQPIERARLLLLVAWLHAVIVTRLQYVPDSWSKRYEFNETDLCSAARVACTWIDRTFAGGCPRDHLPSGALDWNAISFLIGETVLKF
jgi:dynein heavy chain 1